MKITIEILESGCLVTVEENSKVTRHCAGNLRALFKVISSNVKTLSYETGIRNVNISKRNIEKLDN